MVVQLTCLLAVLLAFLHTLSWSTLASPRMARHAVHAYGLRACWLCYPAALDIQGFVVCSVPCLIAAVRMYHSHACWLWGLAALYMQTLIVYSVPGVAREAVTGTAHSLLLGLLAPDAVHMYS